MEKLNFIKAEFPQLLRKLDATAKGEWGVMNAQQMVEHMAESFSYATGKNTQQLHTPPEFVEKAKAFAMSDKEFKPNTKNALMPEMAVPTRKASIEEAIKAVEEEIGHFVTYFENNKDATLMNSFFGELNFEEWTHLLHKHAVHHSRQFGLM